MVLKFCTAKVNFFFLLSRMELENNKADIISTLGRKLYEYLNSSEERENILNPVGERKIDDFWNLAKEKKEILKRIESGIQKWCESVDVQSMIEVAGANIRLLVKDIESQLLAIEIDMTGIDNRNTNKGVMFFGLGLGISLWVLILPFSVFFAFAFAVISAPLYASCGYYIGSEGRRKKANEIYDEVIHKISMSELEASFENSFGKEYSKVIVRIFDESLPKMIKNLLDTNQRLRSEHKAINLKHESFIRLKEKIKKIQESTENFESNWL